jgi:deoxyribodipyrimidine photo-lyase
MTKKVSVFWFRRDLRLEDNCGLFHALKESDEVLPVFVFDKNILNQLEDENDARVSFIYKQIIELNSKLVKLGSGLHVVYGSPEELFESIFDNLNISTVYTNHDYEPYAITRDERLKSLFERKGILFRSFKDQVIFEKDEVVKDDGLPYTVFTPYANKWKKRKEAFGIESYPSETLLNNFIKDFTFNAIPSLADMGFVKSEIDFPPSTLEPSILDHYKSRRDYPAERGTSKLSVHLRFGTVSVRQLANKAYDLSETWVNELIWRDFYQMILWHFPRVVGNAFKPAYDNIIWRNNQDEFNAWCIGNTGYPIVDAGMRELLATGFMHNRVRMITASFLTKHLLIDWRWGEAWFARYLLDFDLASNNGGWQWAASSGCDAAPYFRVFNPYLQTKKFDPKGVYIRKWVPEFESPTRYPQPIVNHELARKRVLETYKTALS